MIIIKDKIEELIKEINFLKTKKYDDEELNDYYNYWCFFIEQEEKIIKVSNISLEIVLYSKYYWSEKYKNRYISIYGMDVSIEQQQYKILEEMERRLQDDIDWSLIERMLC